MKNFNAPAKAKVAFIVKNQQDEITFVFVEQEGIRQGERSFTNPEAIALDVELANRKIADPADPKKEIESPAHLVMVKSNGKPTLVGDTISYFQPSDATAMPFMAGANDAFRKRQFGKQLTAVLDIQESVSLVDANVEDVRLAEILKSPLYARAERIMQGNKKQDKPAVTALQADAFKN
jgi:hypothetical protein